MVRINTLTVVAAALLLVSGAAAQSVCILPLSVQSDSAVNVAGQITRPFTAAVTSNNAAGFYGQIAVVFPNGCPDAGGLSSAVGGAYLATPKQVSGVGIGSASAVVKIGDTVAATLTVQVRCVALAPRAPACLASCACHIGCGDERLRRELWSGPPFPWQQSPCNHLTLPAAPCNEQNLKGTVLSKVGASGIASPQVTATSGEVVTKSDLAQVIDDSALWGGLLFGVHSRHPRTPACVPRPCSHSAQGLCRRLAAGSQASKARRPWRARQQAAYASKIGRAHV